VINNTQNVYTSNATETNESVYATLFCAKFKFHLCKWYNTSRNHLLTAVFKIVVANANTVMTMLRRLYEMRNINN